MRQKYSSDEWAGILAGKAMPADIRVGESLAAYLARTVNEDPEPSTVTIGEPEVNCAQSLPTDDALRALWRAEGGSFHGPITETGCMLESKLLPFLRRIGAARGDSDPLDAAVNLDALDPKYWEVEVRLEGQSILTIGHNHLSGLEHIDRYAAVVRECAAHLDAFIGK